MPVTIPSSEAPYISVKSTCGNRSLARCFNAGCSADPASVMRRIVVPEPSLPRAIASIVGTMNSCVISSASHCFQIDVGSNGLTCMLPPAVTIAPANAKAACASGALTSRRSSVRKRNSAANCWNSSVMARWLTE